MLETQLERLAERGVNLLPAVEITTHFIFERDGFVALVERKEDGFGAIGAPGLLGGPAGFAALVWRGAEPWFVARNFEQQATPDQVASIRRFAADLDYALRQL
ncbi:MAG: hypothetical protein JSU00_31140 [Acidobacteria bacterium]|nr:hypothetical protein [Acidobacteriota bacterium]